MDRELDRVGAFSDGVFAIAITLLVLNIDVPDVGGTISATRSRTSPATSSRTGSGSP